MEEMQFQNLRLFATKENNETVPVHTSKHGRLFLNVQPVYCHPGEAPITTHLLHQTLHECQFYPPLFETFSLPPEPQTTIPIASVQKNLLIVRNNLPRVRIEVTLPPTATPFKGFYVLLVQDSSLLLDQFQYQSSTFPHGVFNRLPETELVFKVEQGQILASGVYVQTQRSPSNQARVFFFRSDYDSEYPSNNVQQEAIYLAGEVPAPILVQFKGLNPTTQHPIWAITLAGTA